MMKTRILYEGKIFRSFREIGVPLHRLYREKRYRRVRPYFLVWDLFSGIPFVCVMSEEGNYVRVDGGGVIGQFSRVAEITEKVWTTDTA